MEFSREKQSTTRRQKIKQKGNSTNSLSTILELIGAKWKLIIIQYLMSSDMRFCELRNKVGCTSKVLVSCLKELENNGFVVREEEERSVSYYLTDLGYTLRPVIDSMCKWGKEYKKLQKLIKSRDKNCEVL